MPKTKQLISNFRERQSATAERVALLPLGACFMESDAAKVPPESRVQRGRPVALVILVISHLRKSGQCCNTHAQPGYAEQK